MKRLTKILRWSTKLFSIAILALVFYIIGAHVIEADFNGLPTLTDTEKLSSVSMGLLFLGTLVALKWELSGGVITILGYLGFVLIDRGIVNNLVFNLFLLSGVLNVILYWLEKRQKSND